MRCTQHKASFLPAKQLQGAKSKQPNRILQKTQLKNVITMQRILIALALSPAAAYVTPLKPRQLSKLSMQSDVSDLYSSKGVSTSAVAVADEVAEDEVISLKPEAVEAVVVGEEHLQHAAVEIGKHGLQLLDRVIRLRRLLLRSALARARGRRHLRRDHQRRERRWLV